MRKRMLVAVGLSKIRRLVIPASMLEGMETGHVLTREDIDRIRAELLKAKYHRTYTLLDCICGIAVGCGTSVVVMEV